MSQYLYAGLPSKSVFHYNTNFSLQPHRPEHGEPQAGFRPLNIKLDGVYEDSQILLGLFHYIEYRISQNKAFSP